MDAPIYGVDAPKCKFDHTFTTGASEMNIKVVGIDLAKVYFQICVLSDDHTVISNKKIHREKMLPSLRELPADTLVALEACGRANYWGD